jgi:hypothetical protein
LPAVLVFAALVSVAFVGLVVAVSVAGASEVVAVSELAAGTVVDEALDEPLAEFVDALALSAGACWQARCKASPNDPDELPAAALDAEEGGSAVTGPGLNDSALI